MFFTIDNKNLIVAHLDGCVAIWKLNSKIKVYYILFNNLKNNIEKKKQSLGLISKKVCEILRTSKQLTLDTYWIE